MRSVQPRRARTSHAALPPVHALVRNCSCSLDRPSRVSNYILEKLSVLLFSKDDLKRAEDLSRRALWSLELRMGSPSQGAPDDTSELLQQTQDLKSLIANIHDTRRKEGEKAVRDDNASF